MANVPQEPFPLSLNVDATPSPNPQRGLSVCRLDTRLDAKPGLDTSVEALDFGPSLDKEHFQKFLLQLGRLRVI
jgi:hypothetical protein